MLGESLQSIPIKVCVHEKARIERTAMQMREQQIQTMCKEYEHLIEQHHLQGQAHGIQVLHFKQQTESLLHEIDTLREHNMQQCARISELTIVNGDLHQKLTEAQAAAREQEQRPKQQESQAKEVEGLHLALKELRGKFTKTQEQCEGLKLANEQLQHQLQTLKGDLEHQVSYNRQLVKSNNLAHGQMEKKEKLLGTAEAERKAAASEVSVLAQKIKTLSRMLEGKDREEKKVQDEFHELDSECQRLQRERGRLKKENVELQKQAEEAQKQKEDHTFWLQEARAENQRLLNALFAYSARYGDDQLWVDATTNCSCNASPSVIASRCCVCGGTGVQLGTTSGGPQPVCSMHRPAPVQGAPPDPLHARVRFAPAAAEVVAAQVPGPPRTPMAAISTGLQELQAENGLLMNRLVEQVQLLNQAP